MPESPQKLIRIVCNAGIDRMKRRLPAISRDRTQMLLQRHGSPDNAARISEILASATKTMASPYELKSFFQNIEEKLK